MGKLVITEGVEPIAPVGTGKYVLYIDSADKKLKIKDEAGIVYIIAIES